MMKNNIKLSASLACANFKHLEQDVRELDAAGVDAIHFDVMDGHFVPNFGLNLEVLRSVREITSMPVNIHLMVANPEMFIPVFASEQPNLISFQVEATPHPQRELARIRGYGIKAGLALNPSTPLSVLDYILADLDVIMVMGVNPGFSGQKLIPAMVGKIAQLRRMLAQQGARAEIAVDGNVSFENIPTLVNAGATMLVGGTSSIFHKGFTISEAVNKVRGIIP
jgi:ribulose-phosphate 3-epimerase